MPHLVVFYTANLEAVTDMTTLCRSLADAMLSVRDDAGKPVFPTGGTRVFAFPAPHFAVADDGSAGRAAGGTGEYGYMYLNVRMAAGRSASVHSRTGDAVLAAVRARMDPIMQTRHIGITVQVDEGHEVYDFKHNNIHPLFQPPTA